MGGQVSEVAEETTARADGGRQLERAEHPRAPRGKLGLRSEASTRFEKQLHPALTMRAQRIASRLMVELCGARLVPGTIDVDARRVSAGRRRLRCASERMTALLGHARSPRRDERPSISSDSASTPVAERSTSLAVTVPARSPLRRHPRGRSDRGGRARPRDRRAPAGDAARAAGGGRRARAAPAAAAGVPRTSCATPASTRRSPGASSRRTRRPARGSPRTGRAAAIASHNPLSEEQSVMRTDAARLACSTPPPTTSPAGPSASRCSSRARVYLPAPPPAAGGVLDGDFAGTSAGAGPRAASDRRDRLRGARCAGLAGRGRRAPTSTSARA